KVDLRFYKDGDHFITPRSVGMLSNGKMKTLQDQSDLMTELNNLKKRVKALEEVGGRNLLKGTTDEWEEQHRPAGDYFFARGYDYKLTFGGTYTFSIVADKVWDDTTPINLQLGAGITPKTYTKDILSRHLNNIPFGKKVSLTHTVTESDLINKN